MNALKDVHDDQIWCRFQVTHSVSCDLSLPFTTPCPPPLLCLTFLYLLIHSPSVLQTLNKNTPGAWDAIHAVNYHTYATDLGSIQSATSSLHQQFGKPVWITEIAAGGGASMEANIALMKAFVPWANSQGWIERYFWNQAVRPSGYRHLMLPRLLTACACLLPNAQALLCHVSCDWLTLLPSQCCPV